MQRTLTSTLSIQSRGGLVFGSATHIDGMNLLFELEGAMEIGDVVEWRMELPGLDDTAMGRMRIVSRRQDPGFPLRWGGTIQSVSPEDAEVFEVWRRGVESGSRAFAVSKRTGADSWLASTTMVGSSAAERKQAVALEEARRKQRLERAKSLVKNAKSWPDPGDAQAAASVAQGLFRSNFVGSTPRPASGSVSRDGAASGVTLSGANTLDRPRGAVAAALRANIGEASSGAAPGASAKPQAAGSPFAVPTAAFQPIHPIVLFDRGMASIRFQDSASFRIRYKPALLAGMLILDLCPAGAANTRVQFLFTLPSGVTVFAAGKVIAHTDAHSEFSVELTVAHMATIAAE